MHSITQLNLFADNELGDLVKLNTVLNELPDQELINALDEERQRGGMITPIYRCGAL